jgi:hypothetical protein
MSKEDEYRGNALESYDLARKATTSADRGRLLELAEKWLDLAVRAHHFTGPSRQYVGEHRLVTTKLVGDQRGAE